jgi:hypothetical protein
MMDWRRNTRHLIGLIVCLLVLISRVGVAQVDVEIIPKEPEYTFGEVINFNASLNSVAGVDEVLLYIQSSEESDLQIHPVSIESFGNLFVQVDLHEFPLNGFSKVEYWYQINTDHGDTYASPRNTFFYLDNRYQWQSLAGEPFTIHWYQGDLAFGEEVLNVALESLRSTQDILEVFFPDNMDIYVYESPQAMQVAFPKGGQHWIAGHADPFQSVILVSLPVGPEQRLEMERQIPHELMHIALNYTDSHAYSNLPAWFNEGLASQVELYPNPEYQILMDRAFESGQLIPLASLCESFPNDPQRGLLAYAQSASFTLYLYEQYGQPGFNRLMAAYASGMSCERGVAEALGTTLTRLEASWLRENFTDLTFARTYEQYVPWLVLLLVIIAGPIIVAVTVIRRRPKRTEI